MEAERAMVIEVYDKQAVGEFACKVGDWLLTQRFGTVVPVEYRWYLSDPESDDGDEAHVVIELTVEDPPPPPPDYDSLPWRERMRLDLWPREDMDAVETAADAYACKIGAPAGLSQWRPAFVVLNGRSSIERLRKTAGA